MDDTEQEGREPAGHEEAGTSGMGDRGS